MFLKCKYEVLQYDSNSFFKKYNKLPCIFNSRSVGNGTFLSTHLTCSALHIHCIRFILANIIGGRSLFLLYSWGNWGSEQVNNLSTVTVLLNGGARTQAQVRLTQSSCSLHPGLPVGNSNFVFYALKKICSKGSKVSISCFYNLETD